jgi:hypothetical protein
LGTAWRALHTVAVLGVADARAARQRVGVDLAGKVGAEPWVLADTIGQQRRVTALDGCTPALAAQRPASIERRKTYNL